MPFSALNVLSKSNYVEEMKKYHIMSSYHIVDGRTTSKLEQTVKNQGAVSIRWWWPEKDFL